MAANGLPGAVACSRWATSPPVGFSSPNRTWNSSSMPAPSSPAKPRISPERTAKSTGPTRSPTRSPRTSRATGASAGGPLRAGNDSPRARPIIAVTMRGIVVSAVRQVPW